MKPEKRRWAEGDRDLAEAPCTEEQRPEAAEQPVTRPQVRRPLASTAQDDELLLEQEIFHHHRSHTTRTTEFRGYDGQMNDGEHEVSHVRGRGRSDIRAAQRCQILDRAREFPIRDTHVLREGIPPSP